MARFYQCKCDVVLKMQGKLFQNIWSNTQVFVLSILIHTWRKVKKNEFEVSSVHFSFFLIAVVYSAFNAFGNFDLMNGNYSGLFLISKNTLNVLFNLKQVIFRRTCLHFSARRRSGHITRNWTSIKSSWWDPCGTASIVARGTSKKSSFGTASTSLILEFIRAFFQKMLQKF